MKSGIIQNVELYCFEAKKGEEEKCRYGYCIEQRNESRRPKGLHGRRAHKAISNRNYSSISVQYVYQKLVCCKAPYLDFKNNIILLLIMTKLCPNLLTSKKWTRKGFVNNLVWPSSRHYSKPFSHNCFCQVSNLAVLGTKTWMLSLTVTKTNSSFKGNKSVNFLI